MKVWVTKYALTRGLFTSTRNEEWTRTSEDHPYVWVDQPGAPNGVDMYRLGTEAFYDEESAKANVRKRLEAKVKSLRKQLTELEHKLAEDK